MTARVAARLAAVLFTLCAGLVLAMVAGIDLADRSAVVRVLVLLIATMQIGETAWRFVWAAEAGERLLPYLPALAVVTGVPMAIAAHIDRLGQVVGIGSLLVALLCTSVLIKPAERTARSSGQAVSS
ncbi:hypothetical protein ABZX12_14790 [Kribbella sp. NPDC003505]|uniref:hypothetical protein n=1 Tax=Kribbella sp. NPDC003505 TaxID=3154448 RepID=UPI0033B5A9ED